MTTAADLSPFVSPALAELIRRTLERPDREEPALLATVRQAWAEGLGDRLIAEGLLDPRDEPDLEAELEALIEQHGADQPASGFLHFRANEDLSAVITALLDRRSDIEPPATLGEVRDAMAAGLVAELEGEGEIDGDQETALATEMDALIDLHGEDALAEAVIGDPGPR